MKKYFNSRLLIIILILLIIGVIAQTVWLHKQLNELAGKYYLVGREGYAVLYDLKSLEKLVVDMETGVRGYLLTGDRRYLEPYYEARQEIKDCFSKLKELMAGDSGFLASLDKINYEISSWITLIVEPAIAQRQGMAPEATVKSLAAAVDFAGSKKVMDALRDDFDELERIIQGYREQQVQAMQSMHQRLAVHTLVATVVFLIVIGVLGWMLFIKTRQIERQNLDLIDREKKLQQAVRELVAASQMKSEFLANMSHELRTPLNAIIGFAQVLQKQYYGTLTEKQSKYIDYILTSGQHLLSLINDVLDLSKIEAGKLELDLSTFSLQKLLQNSLIMVKEKAARHRLEITLQVDPDIPELTADERKVKQIVYNLLSNAVKFTPDGGKITIQARLLGGDQVQVSVADTGIGIAPEDQERIFEAFVQGDGSYTRQYEGTGLGLALVRRLVELHGGRVWVESAGLGKGSTFYFTLPVQAETGEQR
ncbi:Adaptive-response sensory-kinase SasA [Neomoorella glycerini]|uniref:histidine kinase n=1 Tax=Neomoorella glycerini TaxID=55779 RepID=A0A6I5ZVF3_9FIRM|nr:ATP-binding protein [Moorella glycerini]QGP93980.1 Adaptive-response sensory-kinase SasA [Moorella glycerini]